MHLENSVSLSFDPNPIERVVLVEAVKLSRIVMELTPELYPFLREDELNCEIVLRNGMDALVTEDVLEIVQHSISEYQKDAFIQ
ncbi:MAG: hypothetical protein K0R75_10 [Paenibacillaceae bacterium]|nr:hypothetical protein [Paenibacillaceae bacterium]